MLCAMRIAPSRAVGSAVGSSDAHDTSDRSRHRKHHNADTLRRQTADQPLQVRQAMHHRSCVVRAVLAIATETLGVMMTSAIPNEDAERKATPIYTGCVVYFPDALAAVARYANCTPKAGYPAHRAIELLPMLTKAPVTAGTEIAFLLLSALQDELSAPSELLSAPSELVSMRTEYPFSAMLKRFGHALACIARLSLAMNEIHCPGQPLHWSDKSKASDHGDPLMRHAMQRGARDTDSHRHTAKAAWRALAFLQVALEKVRDRSNSDHRASRWSDLSLVEIRQREDGARTRGER